MAEQQEYIEEQEGVVLDKGVMQLLLDTQHLHNSVKDWLEGKYLLMVNKDGLMKVSKEEYTKPLANKKGVHKLAGWVRLMVNEHTLQGATSNRSEYNQLMQFLNLELATMIFVNGNDWEVDPSNYEDICNTIINLVALALSRTIGDKERSRFTIGGGHTKHILVTDKKQAIQQQQQR